MAKIKLGIRLQVLEDRGRERTPEGEGRTAVAMDIPGAQNGRGGSDQPLFWNEFGSSFGENGLEGLSWCVASPASASLVSVGMLMHIPPALPALCSLCCTASVPSRPDASLSPCHPACDEATHLPLRPLDVGLHRGDRNSLEVGSLGSNPGPPSREISMGNQMAGSFGMAGSLGGESSGLGFVGDDPHGTMSVVRLLYNLAGHCGHGAVCALAQWSVSLVTMYLGGFLGRVQVGSLGDSLLQSPRKPDGLAFHPSTVGQGNAAAGGNPGAGIKQEGELYAQASQQAGWAGQV